MNVRALVLVAAVALAACSGGDSTLVTCTSSLPDFGRPCRSASGCPGIYACDDTGLELVCNAPDRCACADNLLLDSSCFGPDGCQGRYSLCGEDGATLQCVCPTQPPACGPSTAGYGAACRSDSGCPGAMRCDSKGALACDAPTTCACADRAAFGGACTGAGGCAGAYTACEADGTTLKCNCSATCTGATPGVGQPCRGATGCPGTKSCDAAGRALVCNAPSVCACGEQAAFGTSCAGPGGCAGRYDACEPNGTTLKCNCPPPPPACSPSTSGYGQACQSAAGCTGTFVCDAAATALVCNAPASCPPPPPACSPSTSGYGQACQSAAGCAGTYECNAAATALVCNAPSSCPPPPPSCSPSTSGYGAACTTSSGCRGKRLCSAGALACLGADACAAGVVISEVGPGGIGSTQDEFVELHNAASASVDISGMSVWYRYDGATTPSVIRMATIPAGTSLPPGGYYLLAKAGGYTGSVAADQTFTTNLTTTETSVWLMRAQAAGDLDLDDYIRAFPDATPVGSGLSRIADVVGLDTGAISEGTALNWSSGNPALSSFERKGRGSSTAASMADAASDGTLGNAQDTHDNAADFVLRPIRDPQNRSSPAEP